MIEHWPKALRLLVTGALFIALVFSSTCHLVQASEKDYLGFELGATWIYNVTHRERNLDVISKEKGTMKRQVVAVAQDSEQGTTTYSIRETWLDKKEDDHEYLVVKDSSGSYFVKDGEELRLLFQAPLGKGSQSDFSLGLRNEWSVTFWSQVKRDTPLGQVEPWVAKAWDEYGDGSYAELTLESVPYVGILKEAKLERLFPDGCS